MMTYTQLHSNRRKFLALTGLTVPEFELLLAAFPRAYQQLYPTDQTVEGHPRQRTAGGGRKGLLPRPQEKLLFILVYLKTYPLQVVLGELFALSQSQANHWIQRLLPVLQVALDDLGVLPERDPKHFAQSQPASEPDPRLIIDSTERRRQRPKNPEKQTRHYSGRKKTHSDKNVVSADVQSKRIGFLSGTYAGKTADQTIADRERIAYPPGTVLYKDAGFQGYEPAVQETRQAKKKATPRGTPTAEKRTNCKLARIRVRVEHAIAGVKRCRIVKDIFRNTQEGVSDSVIEAASGLHNLRVQSRKRGRRN